MARAHERYTQCGLSGSCWCRPTSMVVMFGFGRSFWEMGSRAAEPLAVHSAVDAMEMPATCCGVLCSSTAWECAIRDYDACSAPVPGCVDSWHDDEHCGMRTCCGMEAAGRAMHQGAWLGYETDSVAELGQYGGRCVLQWEPLVVGGHTPNLRQDDENCEQRGPWWSDRLSRCQVLGFGGVAVVSGTRNACPATVAIGHSHCHCFAHYLIEWHYSCADVFNHGISLEAFST
jgi:hypothetical protein